MLKWKFWGWRTFSWQRQKARMHQPWHDVQTRRLVTSHRGTQQVKLIDFGMATVNRICKKEVHIASYLHIYFFMFKFLNEMFVSSLHLVSSSVSIDVYRIVVFCIMYFLYLVAFISQNLMCTVQVRGKQSYQVRGTKVQKRQPTQPTRHGYAARLPKCMVRMRMMRFSQMSRCPQNSETNDRFSFFSFHLLLLLDSFWLFCSAFKIFQVFLLKEISILDRFCWKHMATYSQIFKTWGSPWACPFLPWQCRTSGITRHQIYSSCEESNVKNWNVKTSKNWNVTTKQEQDFKGFFSEDYPWTSTKKGSCQLFEYISTLWSQQRCIGNRWK